MSQIIKHIFHSHSLCCILSLRMVENIFIRFYYFMQDYALSAPFYYIQFEDIQLMSIYSGFATRFQEQAYDNCIDSLLYILQKRIIKFYQGETADEEKFITLVLKLHQQMRNMQKSKYLQPKSSLSVNELIKFMTTNQHIMANGNNSNVKSKASQPAEVVEEKHSAPQIAIEKKKSTFWVEKKPEGDINSNKTEQEVQTMGTINKNANHSSKDKTEFRRTNYQPRNIRAFNVKNASRSKLSGEMRQERYLGVFDEKQTKKRTMSNHLNIKPVINKQSIEEAQLSNHFHKRKSRSISRANHDGNEGEVSDIIKDYIIKAKKSYLRGHRIREGKESTNKISDF